MLVCAIGNLVKSYVNKSGWSKLRFLGNAQIEYHKSLQGDAKIENKYFIF